jgi:hypothetical protein
MDENEVKFLVECQEFADETGGSLSPRFSTDDLIQLLRETTPAPRAPSWEDFVRETEKRGGR